MTTSNFTSPLAAQSPPLPAAFSLTPGLDGAPESHQLIAQLANELYQQGVTVSPPAEAAAAQPPAGAGWPNPPVPDAPPADWTAAPLVAPPAPEAARFGPPPGNFYAQLPNLLQDAQTLLGGGTIDVAERARHCVGLYYLEEFLQTGLAVQPDVPGVEVWPGLYFLPETPPPVEPVPAAKPPLLPTLNLPAIRQDFPLLQQKVHGKPLVWLDNAATTQKPQCVIDALSRFYREDNSNVHRGAHTLAARATNAYEGARDKVQQFLGAASSEEIIFVRGTTEAINLVAQSYGRKYVGHGDEILLTTLEHHANIVPWQMLSQEKGAIIKVAPINDRGEIILEEYLRLLSPRTRLVAIAQVSNVLGTVNPVGAMIELAHRYGARVLIDGAQGAPHMPINVRDLDADFYVFSGHKIYAPTGIGVLYGKREVLEQMPPWQGGGNMINTVTFSETTYNGLPNKFEAGTGNIADAVGLGAALDYLRQIGLPTIERYEHDLTAYAMEALATIPGIRLIGTAPNKISVLSFVIDGVRSEDLGRYLDQEGIAVRTGHHCAQPTLQRYGLTQTVRPSLAMYNTREEVDFLVKTILNGLKSLRHG